MANPIVASDPHSLSQGNIQNVSDLVSGTPLTVPLQSQQERNVVL